LTYLRTWSIILGVLIFGCHIPKKLRWFEQTMWYCRECNKEVAKRKKDGPIQVLAKGD
jgi:hypothetical protein